MKFKVASYELKINTENKIDNIWIFVSDCMHEYYIDIDHVSNIPLSREDKNTIIKLKNLIKNYRKNNLSIFEVISKASCYRYG